MDQEENKWTSLNKEEHDELQKVFRVSKYDENSAGIVIAVLTVGIRRIEDTFLREGFSLSLRLILIRFIHERRRLLNYLSKTDVKRYYYVCKQLGLER